MRGIDTTNGYEVSLSLIFNGMRVTHIKKAREARGNSRIVGHHYIESLWGFFENPAEAIVRERVSRVDPDFVRPEGGLRLWSSYRSNKRHSIVVSYEEVAALRELYDQLDGQLPLKAL